MVSDGFKITRLLVFSYHRFSLFGLRRNALCASVDRATCNPSVPLPPGLHLADVTGFSMVALQYLFLGEQSWFALARGDG